MTTKSEKFWSNVSKQTSCWIWIGYTDSKGYGKMLAFGQNFAHRVSWIIHNGSIPEGMCVLHDCPGGDNPTCVNPNHLWLGTKGDNNRDRNLKGRQSRGKKHSKTMKNQPRGENCYQAKLTENSVRIARNLYYGGESGIPELADDFGVTLETVRMAVKGITWRHVK